MQNIKQLTDGLFVYEMYELSVHLSVFAVRGSADDPSEGNMSRSRETCMAVLPTSDAERNPDCASFSR
jgi:hypothetical protein